MTIIGLHIEWPHETANDPEPVILLDREDKDGPFQFYPSRNRNGLPWHGSFIRYFESGSLAWGFLYLGKADDGFGGWKRSIRVVNTEQPVEVVGGWWPPAMPIQSEWAHAFTRISGSPTGTTALVRIDRLQQMLAQFMPWVRVVKHGDSLRWVINIYDVSIAHSDWRSAVSGFALYEFVRQALAGVPTSEIPSRYSRVKEATSFQALVLQAEIAWRSANPTWQQASRLE